MNKKKLLWILSIVELSLTLTLTVCFFYKFTYVISNNPNSYFLGSSDFAEFSILDGFVKLNICFIILIFLCILIISIRKVQNLGKKSLVIGIVFVLLFVTINGVFLYNYYNIYKEDWFCYSTLDTDFVPIPKKYEKYFPYFYRLIKETDEEVSYDCYHMTTQIGEYIYANTWCDKLNYNFYYEQLQSKSSMLIMQFVTTKGKPSWKNQNEEKVYMESVQNQKYDCSVYSHEDFYEIWFIEENNCTIVRYENFDEVFNMSEEDILKDARYLYDSLKMS